MNETDVKDLFASAVAQPGVDRIDTDAVLRGGRRRHRLRVAATVGTLVAVVGIAASLVVGGTRQSGIIAGPTPRAPVSTRPSVVSPGPTAGGCQDFAGTSNGSIQDQEAVDATADRVRAAAAALPTDNLSVLIVHPADLTVEVLWVGPVPKSLTDLAAREAVRGVTVAFTPANYTRSEMQAAMAVAIRVSAPADDAASRGLTVATAAACTDGSGIKVTIAQKANNEPAVSVPPAVAEAIQSSVGGMPVWVEPGSAPVSQ